MIAAVLLLLLLSAASSGHEYEPVTQPLKLLVLVPWPSDIEGAGWAAGLDLLAGARLAASDINNTTDLLQDYHIELLVPELGHEACSLPSAADGLVNFVQHAINPPGQVLAVLGLYCSTSTKEIASFANQEPIQVVQLSAANSPVLRVLRQQSDHFDTWQFLSSADIYADTMVDLMHQVNWSEIVVIKSLDNIFYNGITEALEDRITSDQHILYATGTGDLFIDNILDEIDSRRGRIIFNAVESREMAKLLCRAAERGMLYPDITWVIVDLYLFMLESENQCNVSLLHRALEGSILCYFTVAPDHTTELVNGDTYSMYMANYFKELNIVAEEYNQTLSGDHQYAGLLYDQVWAFTLALNSSLPELSRRNLSVSDIGSLGYSEAKEILEKELSQLDFRGASGRIRFNQYQEVSNAITIYQVISGEQKQIGNCEAGNNVGYMCNVTFIKAPPPSHLEDLILKLPSEIVIGMYANAGATALVVTIILVLFLYHRNKPEILASSWKLSLIQFCACYMLCVSMAVSTLQSSDIRVAYCYIQQVISVNATICFIVVLFLKVLRVYRLFHNKSLKLFRWQCSNWFLFICTTTLCLIPNAFFLMWFSLNSQVLRQAEPEVIDVDSIRYIKIHRSYCSVQNESLNAIYLVLVVYLAGFASGCLLLASGTRKVSYRHFKDTKKVITFIVTLLVLNAIYIVILFVYLERMRSVYVHLTNHIYSFLNIVFCQSILFVPKLWWIKNTIICNSCSHA